VVDRGFQPPKPPTGFLNQAFVDQRLHGAELQNRLADLRHEAIAFASPQPGNMPAQQVALPPHESRLGPPFGSEPNSGLNVVPRGVAMMPSLAARRSSGRPFRPPNGHA
jgi:hypothetical protein